MDDIQEKRLAGEIRRGLVVVSRTDNALLVEFDGGHFMVVIAKNYPYKSPIINGMRITKWSPATTIVDAIAYFKSINCALVMAHPRRFDVGEPHGFRSDILKLTQGMQIMTADIDNTHDPDFCCNVFDEHFKYNIEVFNSIIMVDAGGEWWEWQEKRSLTLQLLEVVKNLYNAVKRGGFLVLGKFCDDQFYEAICTTYAHEIISFAYEVDVVKIAKL